MKAASAYRTISEVSETLGLPAHVLRFWESKFPQIQPMKRSGGRRFYRPQDIVFLERLRNLLHVQGYTIRGAQILLRAERHNSAQASGTPTHPVHLTDDEQAFFSLPVAAPAIIVPVIPSQAPSLTILLDIRTRLLDLQEEISLVKQRFIKNC
jgi:DNA-binding transcriptional MerR regulator